MVHAFLTFLAAIARALSVRGLTAAWCWRASAEIAALTGSGWWAFASVCTVSILVTSVLGSKWT